MKRGTLNLVVSIIFLLVVGVGYYLIWANAKSSSEVATVDVTAVYAPVDISGIKVQAEKLIQSRVNNGNIPIPTPVDKLGKADPFADPQ